MEKKKRTRRSKAEIEAAKLPKDEPKGLGDTVEKITEVTGIKKVTKWLMGSVRSGGQSSLGD